MVVPSPRKPAVRRCTRAGDSASGTSASRVLDPGVHPLAARRAVDGAASPASITRPCTVALHLALVDAKLGDPVRRADPPARAGAPVEHPLDVGGGRLLGPPVVAGAQVGGEAPAPRAQGD